MNPTLFLLLMYAGALVGLPMGFLHQVWWLFVPPLVFGTCFFGRTARIAAYQRKTYGMQSTMMSSMFAHNVLVTARNTVIQAAVFLIGWAVSLLFS